MAAWVPAARRGLVLLALLAALLTGAVGLAAGGGPGPGGSAFDRGLGASECVLLGRTYDPRLGCARDTCTAPAVPYKRSFGTEMCALPGQGDHGFGSAVEYRRCGELHRRWLSETDWCASNPDRRRHLIPRAPQCVGPASTYVTHRETEGWYDECLRPGRVAHLERLAERHGTSLGREAALRSRTLCASRAGHVFRHGVCTPGDSQAAGTGGTLLVGDSLTWRGTEELGDLMPDLTIDGLPSRQFRDLRGRLDRYRLDHGDPLNLIVELGTNRDRQYSEESLVQDIGSLPTTAVVMYVLPYRADRATPPQVQQSSTVYASWMRTVAATRPRSCIADWRAVVERHPAVLGDGVHPAPTSELFWAKWLKRSWERCVVAAVAQSADS